MYKLISLDYTHIEAKHIQGVYVLNLSTYYQFSKVVILVWNFGKLIGINKTSKFSVIFSKIYKQVVIKLLNMLEESHKIKKSHPGASKSVKCFEKRLHMTMVSNTMSVETHT